MNIRLVLTISFVVVFGLIVNGRVDGQKTLLWDYSIIESNLERYQNNDQALVNAVNKLKEKCDEILLKKINSITEKSDFSKVVNKHDYVSIAPYWWPDPSKKDGFPYINIDGKKNPDVLKIKDKEYFQALFSDIPKLALVYFFTKDEKYAIYASKLIKVWFINEETKMNPNLNYSQYIPGNIQGRSSGLIDSRGMIELLDAVVLLNDSKNWKAEDRDRLNHWVNDFLDWLINSDLGKQGFILENNIGTAYNLQVLYFATLLRRTDFINNVVIPNIMNKLDLQFDSNGVQVNEVKRTKSWDYSISNMSHWLDIVRLAKYSARDLWIYETNKKKSIKKGYSYLMQFQFNQNLWRFQQIRKVNFQTSISSLIIKKLVYGIVEKDSHDSEYEFIAKRKLNAEDILILRHP